MPQADTIDNQEGVLRFAMSQVNPAEPVSGEVQVQLPPMAVAVVAIH